MWDEPKKERACPKCGTETEVKGGDGPGSRSHGMRVCPSSDCNWKVLKSGRWKRPRWLDGDAEA